MSILESVLDAKTGLADRSTKKVLDLSQGELNVEYIIKNIDTQDEEIKNFLFTLGCYQGEKITIISLLADNMVLSIKDARYSIDIDLAKAILI